MQNAKTLFFCFILILPIFIPKLSLAQSLDCSVTNSYASISDSDSLDVGSGDKTLEFWTKGQASNNTSYPFWFSKADNLTVFYHNSEQKLWIGGNAQATWHTFATSLSNILDNAWHSIAFSYTTSDNTFRYFLDGTLIDTSNPTYGINWNSSADLSLCKRISDGYKFTGFIDEVRLSNISRYSSTYTPSSLDFSTDSNTSLLLHFNGNVADSSYNSNVMTLNSGATYSDDSPVVPPDLSSPTPSPSTESTQSGISTIEFSGYTIIGLRDIILILHIFIGFTLFYFGWNITKDLWSK
jgi:hypothetical protein